MIALLSSSPSRAKLLEQAKINYRQISINFDESCIEKKGLPENYTYKVIKLKMANAKEIIDDILINSKTKAILIADSCVCASNIILGKAKSKEEAYYMLSLQNANTASVTTAMVLKSNEFELTSISKTVFEFNKFDKNELDAYINSNQWQGKAGAMMIEGFNGKFILSQKGNIQTAMGLDTEILKAFL